MFTKRQNDIYSLPSDNLKDVIRYVFKKSHERSLFGFMTKNIYRIANLKEKPKFFRNLEIINFVRFVYVDMVQLGRRRYEMQIEQW